MAESAPAESNQGNPSDETDDTRKNIAVVKLKRIRIPTRLVLF